MLFEDKKAVLHSKYTAITLAFLKQFFTVSVPVKIGMNLYTLITLNGSVIS